MTVAAQTPVSSYVGNGSVNSFPFTFPVFLPTQILVTVTTTTGITTLVLGTDYTVSGLNPAGAPASTGSIALISAGQAWLSGGNLATGYTLSITGNVAYSQATSFRNQGDFYRSALEDALDNLEYQIQQLQLAITKLQAGGTIIQPSTILTDTVTGKTYQLQMTNGIFNTLELT